MPIPNIDLSQVIGLRKNSTIAPRISTREGMLNGNRPPPFEFFSDFTDSADMQLHTESSASESRYLENGDELPIGFDASRVSSPPDGVDGLNTHGEITGDNDKTFDESQKSYVTYRRSNTDTTAHGGDSILSKSVPALDSIYVKARFRLGPGSWDTRGSSKLLRIKSNITSPGSGNWGNVGAGIIWGFSHNSFGLRNKLSIASEPSGFNDPELFNMSRSPTGFDYSLSYKTVPYDFNGDGIIDNDPQLADLVNGGVIQKDDGIIATVDHVLGSQWHEIEFFLKANSEAGIADGELWQWLDGSLIMRNTTVPWSQFSNEAGRIQFNAVQLGGNDSFSTPAGEPRVVEWMAWDYLQIGTAIPEGNQLGWNIITN